MKQFKPQIRLPEDDGPNPYDSKTPLQPKIWMTWKFWFAIAAMSVTAVAIRYWNGHF